MLDKISARDTEFEFELSGTATTSAPYLDVLLPTLPIIIPAGSLSTIFLSCLSKMNQHIRLDFQESCTQYLCVHD